MVCAIQPRGAEQVAEKIAVLEVAGTGALDIDCILKRKPEVALVDELAVDNPPGSRHPKRWQDVKELLDSGINVITALNIQHIEEEQDAITSDYWQAVGPLGPQELHPSADEIEVVDVPEEELVKAGAEDSASGSRFSNCARWLWPAPEVIEGQLQRYMDLHGIRQSWGTRERIWCVSRAQQRRRHDRKRPPQRGEVSWTASGGLRRATNVSREDQETLDANLESSLARLRPRYVLQGADAVDEIIRFAQEHRVTQIFIGHTQRSRWLPFVRTARSTSDRSRRRHGCQNLPSSPFHPSAAP